MAGIAQLRAESPNRQEQFQRVCYTPAPELEERLEAKAPKRKLHSCDYLD